MRYTDSAVPRMCLAWRIDLILQKEKLRYPGSHRKLFSELGLGLRLLGSQPWVLSAAQVSCCNSPRGFDSKFQCAYFGTLTEGTEGAEPPEHGRSILGKGAFQAPATPHTCPVPPGPTPQAFQIRQSTTSRPGRDWGTTDIPEKGPLHPLSLQVGD